MDYTTALLIGLGLLVLLSIAFFAVFRGRGNVKVETRLGNFSAEGENPPPPAAIPAGASAEDVKATGDVLTRSTSEGGVRARGIESGGQVTTIHTPGADLPPKS